MPFLATVIAGGESGTTFLKLSGMTRSSSALSKGSIITIGAQKFVYLSKSKGDTTHGSTRQF